MADAQGEGGNQLCTPFIKLGASFNQLAEPQSKILSAWVGFLLPRSRNFVESKRSLETLHGIGDVEGTGQTQSQILETSFDLAEQGVHPFAFLQANHNVWCFIFWIFDFSLKIKH